MKVEKIRTGPGLRHRHVQAAAAVWALRVGV